MSRVLSEKIAPLEPPPASARWTFLVFASHPLGHPMTLSFNVFEVAVVALAVSIVNLVSLDGESNWFEGAQLLAAYIVFAIAFYFHD